jgi:hypothetical protein
MTSSMSQLAREPSKWPSKCTLYWKGKIIRTHPAGPNGHDMGTGFSGRAADAA